MYSMISYLDNKNCYHGDIKPENIILIKNSEGLLEPRLIEFSLFVSNWQIV
jgi:hypothetical protein